jgi:hypothetical protein
VQFAWLQQNWLALCSLSISILALTLSYKKFKHDTRPALRLRRGSEGFEVENVGQAAAVDVTLNLVERVKRPSGILHVVDTLRPGEKSTISAFNWPEALTLKLQRNTFSSMEEIVLRLGGEKIQHDGRTVASYLLTREGKQMVVLRFRAVDGARTFVRMFSPVSDSQDRFTRLMPSNRILRNRLCAFALEKRYAKNPELAPPLPPFELLVHEEENASDETTQRDG